MRSPELLLPFGHPGAWVAVVATLHVLTSHAFALGGFAMALAWLRRAESQGDAPLKALATRFASAMLVGATTVGALSGVWTWFTTMVVQPLGTALLLRQFFWVWLLEWAVFMAELGLAFAFVQALKGAWPARLQLRLGWALVATSWLTLLLISGILAAMLSPGLPGATGFAALWTATWAPQAFLRTGLALVLGGGLGALAAWAWAPDSSEASRLARRLALVGYGGLGLGVLGYCLTLNAQAQSLLPWAWAQAGGGSAALGLAMLGGGGLLWSLQGPPKGGGTSLGKGFAPWGAGLALASGLLGVVAFERAREQLRKPFLLPGVAYGHGVPVAWEGLSAGGVSFLGLAASEPHDLASPKGQAKGGAALFARQCASCHVLGGRRDPLPLVGQLGVEGFALTLTQLPKLHPAMPPFIGNTAERKALAQWLAAAAAEAQVRQAPIPRGQGVAGLPSLAEAEGPASPAQAVAPPAGGAP